MGAFVGMSKDQHDGVNDSLWRTGKETATLSSWIIETPAGGVPRLRVLLANPGEGEKVEMFNLDEGFWKGGGGK
jgi:hypothetical protein